MPKPADSIPTWVSVLDPDEELAARLALCRINAWCRHDPVWIRRIEKLSGELIKTPADRRCQWVRAESGVVADDEADDAGVALADALTAALRE